MAQNVTVAGASFTDVPAVDLPKTGGGTARFTDVSDTTASASTVINGYYFYDSDGVKTQGSATFTIDSDTVFTVTKDENGDPITPFTFRIVSADQGGI